jgi:acetylserotonin N-methyltransferase
MTDPGPVLDLIQAFRRSKTMFAATALGVFDLLHDRPQTAAEVAAALDTHPEATARLLEACAGLGLLTRDGGGAFANLPVAGEYLRLESGRTLAGYILYSNDALYPMWGRLEDAIREGSHRWHQTFGSGEAIFSGFYRTPEARRTFLRGMHGLGLLSSPEVVRAFDLGGFKTMVDLGGGTGHLAIAACERYPAMRGIVFDLPEAVAEARPHVAASPARDRLETIPGDFFEDPLPPAGLYALGRIVHDWSEERIIRLLARIHQALPPGGGLLLAEALLDDGKCGPVPALMQSLNMLVCTEGRERSLPEYRTLLESAGFSHVEARRTGAPLDAILALKESA